MCDDAHGRAMRAVYVWEDRGRQRDGVLSTSAVECAKRTNKMPKNVHRPLNGIRLQAYRWVSSSGPPASAAARTIAVWC